jgi:D-methionine transport system ATP-binding protein
MIKIHELEKSFKDVSVLKGVSITIKDSEIYGIVGQSGAGKSTLLRCINGLESFESGYVEVDGTKVDVKDKVALKNLRRRMGMIFQGFNLLERLDVYDNIALPLKFWGIKTNTEESRKKILDLIELVGLSEKVHAKPRELSGGQKQRVAIARALVLDPEFLLCDEATSALDPEITKGILALLQKINKELGITIIVVTHQMEVVKQICNKVAFLSGGKVLAEGKPEEMFIQPRIPEIKAFLHDRSEILPDYGVNIQLFFTGEGSMEPIVTMMARELDEDFSICWAKIEDFRDELHGSLVINAKEEDEERICSFLDKKNVSWEVLK